jgi:hypothetical protein
MKWFNDEIINKNEFDENINFNQPLPTRAYDVIVKTDGLLLKHMMVGLALLDKALNEGK